MESDSAVLAQQPSIVLDTSSIGAAVVNSKDVETESCNPMEEIDEGQGVVLASPASPVAPSNTPITGDSGQTSPVIEQVSSDGSSDDGQKDQSASPAKEDQVESKVSPQVNGQAPDDVSQAANGKAAVSALANGGAIPKEIRKEEKKSSSSGTKAKRREDKGGIDSILRALNSLESPEEKLAAICKKYADLHEEHRVLQSSFKTQQRSVAGLVKERDQVSSEHAKAIIAKSRLESLCRELQKHNKLVKEESLQRAKEDDEKRKELSTKFQSTIGEIQTQMNSNNDRNSKLQEENMALAKQLKQFVEQYEVREQKVRQHRDLEQQVAEAKLAKANAVLKEEQERNTKEKELLLHKIAESSKKITVLEAQVRVFKERYDEFESLHTRSNETFQKYKTEMDKMGKRIKKLEKDGLAWKSKWETSNKALIESIEARSKSEQETKTWVQKTKTLESLCRALQEKLHEKPSANQAEAAQQGVSPTNEAPPNSPEQSSSGQASPDSTPTPWSEDSSSNPPPTVSSTQSQMGEETDSGSAPTGTAAAAAATTDPSSTPAPQSSSPSPSSQSSSSPSSSADPVPGQGEAPAVSVPSGSDPEASSSCCVDVPSS